MLGIVGGVGPHATARLYLGLTERAVTERDDLPGLLIHSVAMTREIEDAFLTGQVGPRSPELAQVRGLLAHAVRTLVAGGAEAIVMPCNTLQEELRRCCVRAGVAHIDMLDAAARSVAAAGARRVLVLATATTCSEDLYGQRLREHGVDCVYPNAVGQELVQAQIRASLDLRRSVGVGQLGPSLALCSDFDAVLIACTDLSKEQVDFDAPVFDALECLIATVGGSTERAVGRGAVAEEQAVVRARD